MADTAVPQDLDAKLEADFDALPDNLEQAAETSAPAETPSRPEPAAPTAAQTAAPPAVDPSQGQTRSKDYNDFVAKHGGDVDAAARAYWDANNRLAQQERELNELRAKVAQAPAPPAEPVQPEPKAVPANVQRYQTDKDEAEAAWKRNGDTLQQYTGQRAELQRELDQITSSLFYGGLELDAEEKARARGRQIRSGLAEYDRAIERLEAQRERNLRDYKDAKDKLEIAGQYAEIYLARQAEKDKADKASLDRFGSTFFGLLPTIAGEGEKIPEKLLPRFRELAKKEALLRLTAPGTDLDTADVPGFLRQVKTDFLALVKEGHEAQSAVYAVKKTADTEVKAPEGQKAVAPGAKTSRWQNREELEAHIDAQLGL